MNSVNSRGGSLQVASVVSLVKMTKSPLNFKSEILWLCLDYTETKVVHLAGNRSKKVIALTCWCYPFHPSIPEQQLQSHPGKEP
jgi:hypothetical protein